jgi:hypothetical protein
MQNKALVGCADPRIVGYSLEICRFSDQFVSRVDPGGHGVWFPEGEVHQHPQGGHLELQNGEALLH